VIRESLGGWQTEGGGRNGLERDLRVGWSRLLGRGLEPTAWAGAGFFSGPAL
jgi:hypothetical protein